MTYLSSIHGPNSRPRASGRRAAFEPERLGRRRLCGWGMMALIVAVALTGFAGPSFRASAESTELLDPAVNEVTVDEQLGEKLDPDIEFVDHQGKTVKLGSYFTGDRPILLTLNYYRCPGLCNIQLNAITDTLRELDWTPGDDNFRMLTFSIDPRENTELAKSKRRGHLKSLGRGDDVDWAFHTGSALNIKLLAAQLGVGYAYDKAQDQYGHPPVIMFISPEGKVARYLYGLTYTAKDVKFALLEAAEGRVGSTVERLILSCFHYDATLGKYGPFAMGIMRLAGGLMVLIGGTALGFAWRRERRKSDRLEARA